MARKARHCPGGYVYHVLNRAAGRITLFRSPEDYAAFARIMVEAHARVPLRIVSWCLMKNHWHFVVWPRGEQDVTNYFRFLTHTHAMRWRVARGTVGWGPLYQGRFKSFPVQSGSHVPMVCRYVERNALTAGVVKRAEDWRWGSLWLRRQKQMDEPTRALREMLSAGPAGRWPELKGWTQTVNRLQTKGELAQLEASETRGRPLGDEAWLGKMVRQGGLEHTVRPEGRPSGKRPAGRV
ncbi:MAG: hypothetical protein HKL96_10450 [Phycisphaerales bacterium]|nr:hypothetical protein [Phycisphaerales bacterium]